ncbi:MAG: glycosyltransferase family 2 protein [Candidatus Eremiobacteraeota bacterium]|nr:glycosyltransferase family 2 protein [Candidatus Eremiobacteraeota bacterium]
MKYDLVVVLPIYNEKELVFPVLSSWISVLERLSSNFLILAINDGSSDGTEQALSAFADNSSVEIINKANSGHGPTILMGYRKAMKLAPWIFQCDSDDEMKAESFPELWENKDRYDVLYGARMGRTQSLARRIVTLCAGFTVKMLYGHGVKDVNTPYRLIRSTLLEEIINEIPDDTFAPNVIITGALHDRGARSLYVPIPYHPREKRGGGELVNYRLIRASLISFIQTVQWKQKTRQLGRK